MILLFVACSGAASPAPGQPLEQGASSSAAVGSKNSQLEAVTSALGLAYTVRADTDNGYYELWQPSGFSANILYTDYKTKQRVYLSAQPNSDHHNEADPSWIQYTIGGTVPFVAKEKLYVCQLGLNVLGLSYEAEDLPKVWQMDLNGDNRRELFSLPADETFCESSVFVADEQSLYVLVRKHFEEGTEFQLLRVDVTTGAKTTLAEFPSDENYNLVGCFSGGLLLQTVFTQENETMKWKEIYDNQAYTLSRYYLATGEVEPVLNWKQGEVVGLAHEGKYYYWEKATNSVKVLDVNTQKTKTIATNVFQLDQLSGNVRCIGIYDAHCLFEVPEHTSMGHSLYAVELFSGKIDTITMQNEDRIISIFAEGSDYFAVNVGEKSITVPDTAPDGTPMETMRMELKMALITKEDYWNNRENFIEIQDRVAE